MTDIATTSGRACPSHTCRLWPGRFRLILNTLLGLVCVVQTVSAEERHSDARSLLHLFGRGLSTDVLGIRERSRRMPLEERYAYLLRQVLPPDTDQVRIAIEFLPTNPSPPVRDRFGSPELPLLHSSRQHRIPSGGVPVSPVLDLIELARQFDRLAELQEDVSHRSPADSEQVKARSALLVLIAAASGNQERYAALLDEFMALVRESPVGDTECAPELIVVWQGAQNPQTRAAVRDLLLFLREQMKFGGNPVQERIKRHIFSLHYQLDEEVVRMNPDLQLRAASETLEHWHVVSRDRAATRGAGYPNAFWTDSPTRPRHVSSHGADYLYFDTPLRGNYEIEGEFSTFSYREIRLAVGMVWAGPLYDHKQVQWGDFRAQRPNIRLETPFTKMDDLMRVRVVVEDGVRTTYINGRAVFTSSQGPDSEPWIAVVSPWHTSGEMQNVRISGQPQIPSEIDLIAGSELPGWLPYYGENVGQPSSTWSLLQPRSTSLIERLNPFRQNAPAVLVGQRNVSLTGQLQESLLRYHRPMLEDGTIEYEFYYQSGEADVFPALDRCCFVFDSERTGVHWLTDGKHDRTGVDPANFSPVAHPGPIPLQPNEWNRVQLNLQGEVVRIALNGETVLTRELEPENLRTFGLFHYADRTTAMIRNLRWRGDWSQQLPIPREQELADFALEAELARGPELKTVFDHDFSEGLPLDRIWVAGHNWQAHTQQHPNGVQMLRSGGSYEKNSLSLPFGLAGDFDVVWEFEDFQSTVAESGNGNVHLLILLDDDQVTECRLYRKLGHPTEDKQEQLVQPAIFYATENGKTKYSFPVNVAEESTGGKLRAVRRGTRMYFLYAEGDSDFFRLVYQTDVSDTRVKFGGIRGIIETHQAGQTAAVWKRVTVRAEAVPDELKSGTPTVKELDEQRSLLAQSVSFELNRDADPGRLLLAGEPLDVTRESDGWLVRQPGNNSWQATWLKPQFGLQGDFDVTLDFEVLKFEQSKSGSESTVYLHADFDTERPLAIEIKFSKDVDSPRSLEIQMSTSGRDGGLRHDELKQLKADRVTQLRLVRRGEVAYLIARQSPGDEPEIFGRIDVGQAAVPLGSLGVGVHTGGAGQETIVRLKSLEIRAEKFK